MSRKKKPADIETDLDTPLWGAAAIGAAMGCNERRAYHLLENGLVPATKVGNVWSSTRRRLREHFNPTLRGE
jgi:hypothetical protein